MAIEGVNFNLNGSPYTVPPGRQFIGQAALASVGFPGNLAVNGAVIMRFGNIDIMGAICANAGDVITAGTSGGNGIGLMGALYDEDARKTAINQHLTISTTNNYIVPDDHYLAVNVFVADASANSFIGVGPAGGGGGYVVHLQDAVLNHYIRNLILNAGDTLYVNGSCGISGFLHSTL